MSVTRQGSTLTMTADNDAVAAGQVFFINGITFQGTGLTAGQRLRVTDAGGSVLADYVVADTTDNADLWLGRPPRFANGITMEDGPAAGTWVVTIFLE